MAEASFLSQINNLQPYSKQGALLGRVRPPYFLSPPREVPVTLWTRRTVSSRNKDCAAIALVQR